MMRIFIGLTEICNIVATYAKGFRALGHETYTMILSKHPLYPTSQYDVVVDEHIGGNRASASYARSIKQQVFLLSKFPDILKKCDISLFLFGTSFIRGFLDYPILKLCGKRIVSVFAGSDVRYWYAFEQEARLLGMEDRVRPYIDHAKHLPGAFFSVLLEKVQVAERYADLILSQPGCGQLQTKPYMRGNIPLDLSQFRFNVPEREVPLVLHAPRIRGPKGTEYVLATVEQLKREGVPFEFRLIENMPNAEVRELLAEADIVVDELFADTVGTLSTESMATGNVVLVSYPAEYARVPAGCPAVNVTKDTLTDNLRKVILNRDLRRQLARAGRPYVEANNDHVRIAQQILDWLKPDGIQEYDFVPTFYRDFVMPPELLKQERRLMWEHRMQRLTNLLFSRFSREDE